MRPTWHATNNRAEYQWRRQRAAFTLVELLVSMTILLVLLVALVGMVNQTSSLWRNTNGRIEQFRQARDAFEALTRRLSQGTLNTYLDYVDANGNPRVSAASTTSSVQAFTPDHYARQSELRFISGPGLAGDSASTPPRPGHAIFFQAPLGFVADGNAGDATTYGGLENLLNTWGYYIEFNNDGNTGLNADGTGLKSKPSFVKSPDRYRFRLMELMQPSEALSLYNYTAANPGLKSTDTNGRNWFTDALPPIPARALPPSAPASTTWSHVIAENIVAMVILPKLSPGDQAAGGYSDGSLAPGYSYDSTLPGAGATDAALNSQTQLPPLLTVTIVAVDEASYARFQGTSTAIPADLKSLDTLFQTVGDTKDPANPGFARDLQTLQGILIARHVTYRVFTTDIGIKGAKWSRAAK